MAKRKTTSKKRPIEQYSHDDKKRVNNPPVGMVTPDTDKDAGKKKYQYDPHLDPQLQWAGKAEHTSFEVDTVSLHVHERIDPKTIVEAVKKKNGSTSQQGSLFEADVLPVRDEIEFYKHKHNWSNRLIAGDSMLVMNSLIEKEGLAGQVQMIYIDPPYGIKYGSNFQPFVNKRDVKDGKDEDLTQEPETVKAFRDTWELGIHSYLSYLRDRLLLSRELLHESGSVFVQISDENLHHVRELLDEVFGSENFFSIITFSKGVALGASGLPGICDFIIWYSKNKTQLKFRQIFEKKEIGKDTQYTMVRCIDGIDRRMTEEEKENPELLKGSKIFRYDKLTSAGFTPTCYYDFEIDKKVIKAGKYSWKTNKEGMDQLIKMERVKLVNGSPQYVYYFDDFPVKPIKNLWPNFQGASNPTYVVQTSEKIFQRCLIMSTDPGDLVFDPTCGSGTIAYVAEQWGRRWMTCDTSRVAVTLAKQRLMTAIYDYYELAHSKEGVGSGFKYKTVPHITLKSIANNEPPGQETLYDQPSTDRSKTRVTGPFTVEAVPSLAVRSLDEIGADEKIDMVDNSISRSGESVRQSDWRDELMKTGIRGKNGQYILFSRVETLPGTRWLHADAESKQNDLGSDRVSDGEKEYGFKPERVVVSFGPEHSPLEQRQVALAIEEAQTLVPKPKIVVFASFQFDPEAAKDIDEMNWPGVTLLKVQMNTDMLTEDLKKKRSSNESFWLIGQPDVIVVSGEWLVESGSGESFENQKRIAEYELYKKLSGLNSLAEINGLGKKDLQFYTLLSQRGDLWLDLAAKEIGGFDSGEYSGRSDKKINKGVSSIPGDSKRIIGGIGDIDNIIGKFGLRGKNKFREFIEGLRRDKQIVERSEKITVHSPLTTVNYYEVEVNGFDYYNTKTGNIESGGNNRIAMWLLDTDYDGKSLFPKQVFFPMAAEKEGWSKLAKNLKAEIDEELIEAYKGTKSLPFKAGNQKRIAIKIIDDRGIESLKMIWLEE